MDEPTLPTVLITDDAADTRRMLSEILKPHCVVLLAKNGMQALERARTQRPDLVLLDVVMPGMTGFEVLAKLQADPATARIPVLFLTGLDTEGDIERGLQQGAVDYIVKPFLPEVVLARVLRHAHLAHQAQQLHTALSGIDERTGLPDRESLIERAAREDRRAARAASTWALLLLDLRHATPGVLGVRLDALVLKLAQVLGEHLDPLLPWAARVGDRRLALLLPEAQLIDPETQVLGPLPKWIAAAAAGLGDGPVEFRAALEAWRGRGSDFSPELLDPMVTRLDRGEWRAASCELR